MSMAATAGPRHTALFLLLCLLSTTALAAARGVVDAELKSSLQAGGANLKSPNGKPPPGANTSKPGQPPAYEPRGAVDAAELKAYHAGGNGKKPVVKPPYVAPGAGTSKPGGRAPPVYPAPGTTKPGPGAIPTIPGFTIPGMGGIGNGIPGLGGGWGGGYGGPAGGYSRGGVVAPPSVVCAEKGPCYRKRVTCPKKCFSSYSGAGKGYGGGGGGGSCTVDCKVKCTAYC